MPQRETKRPERFDSLRHHGELELAAIVRFELGHGTDDSKTELARCLDTLLTLAAEGRAFWRVYRQFKMYNSPDLNPYLYARR